MGGIGIQRFVTVSCEIRNLVMICHLRLCQSAYYNFVQNRRLNCYLVSTDFFMIQFLQEVG
jgi:hypothetical protein